MRTHINIIGNGDYSYTVKDLTEKEIELLKSIAYETRSSEVEMEIEVIPTAQELINEFNEFKSNPRYSDWATSDIVEDFISTRYVSRSWQVMEFLTNELNRTI